MSRELYIFCFCRRSCLIVERDNAAKALDKAKPNREASAKAIK